jgi:hypothetical protein
MSQRDQRVSVSVIAETPSEKKRSGWGFSVDAAM